MDPHAPAEELPALYRAILDLVATLEAAGDREEGLRVRRAAVKAYSRAWDARAGRQLTALLQSAQRRTDTHHRPTGRPTDRPAYRANRAVVAPDR